VILAGDIGGTKANLALFEDVQSKKVLKEERFLCRDFTSVGEILRAFVPAECAPIQAACLGIAGPIEDNICRATNLPWVIQSQEVTKFLQTPHVFLLNDLEANAWGIPLLQKEELYLITPGDDRKGNRALLSPGTGLGEAGIYFDGSKHTPFPCEGGHASFAPRNEEEVELWRYLRDRFGHVSYERVLSGQGIANIYQFFVHKKKEVELQEVRERLQKEDQAKVIHEYAENKTCALCQKTMDCFFSICGAEAGNLALKFLALGGVFLGGGILPKTLSLFRKDLFMESFLDKGRFASLLAQVRIEIIMNPKTALLGAGYYAQSRL